MDPFVGKRSRNAKKEFQKYKNANFFMVPSWFFMVFHGSRSVFMVKEGQLDPFVGKRSRNAKKEFQKYKNAKKTNALIVWFNQHQHKHQPT